jgi:periplasmic protein TonB
MTAGRAVEASQWGWRESLLLHVCVIGALVGYQLWINRTRDTFGDPNSPGASAGISSVSQIPIPRRDARVNPVANDTETEIPKPDRPEPKTTPKTQRDDPDAIALEKRKKSPKETEKNNRKYLPDPTPPNQVSSNVGQAAVSPLIGVQGSGGIGAAANSPLGARFGWYEKLIRERVGQKWRTNDVEARLRTAPPCIVSFVIARDGNVSGVRVVQSSGIYSLDQSAQRAIYEASPLPPLPQGFERNTANIEFWFELKR